MFFDALNEYCAEGTGGADIFACTAAQATFGIYHGDARSILSFALLYHFYCAVGAVTLAVVAADSILVGYAVVGDPHSSTNFCRTFLHSLYIALALARGFAHPILSTAAARGYHQAYYVRSRKSFLFSYLI